jgi:hypothetical protein
LSQFLCELIWELSMDDQSAEALEFYIRGDYEAAIKG